jgi:hypothetical protein
VFSHGVRAILPIGRGSRGSVAWPLLAVSLLLLSMGGVVRGRRPSCAGFRNLEREDTFPFCTYGYASKYRLLRFPAADRLHGRCSKMEASNLIVLNRKRLAVLAEGIDVTKSAFNRQHSLVIVDQFPILNGYCCNSDDGKSWWYGDSRQSRSFAGKSLKSWNVDNGGWLIRYGYGGPQLNNGIFCSGLSVVAEVQDDPIRFISLTVVSELANLTIGQTSINRSAPRCVETLLLISNLLSQRRRLLLHFCPLFFRVVSIDSREDQNPDSSEASKRFNYGFNVSTTAFAPTTLRYVGYTLLSGAFFLMASGVLLFCGGLLYGRWYWSVLACIGGILLVAFAAILTDHALDLVDSSYEHAAVSLAARFSRFDPQLNQNRVWPSALPVLLLEAERSTLCRVLYPCVLPSIRSITLIRMKITPSGLSVVSGILAIPPTVTWYLDHVGVIHLPADLNDWLSGIAVSLFAIAMIANAFVHRGIGKLIGQREQDAQAPESQQTPSSTQAGGSSASATFLKAADCFKTFDNPVLIDVEKIVRTEAEKYEPGSEREKYLVRALASITTIGAFEITYANIFGSQLRALDDLRTHPEGMTVESLRRFFDEGLLTVPEAFRNRTFDQWLNYLLAINKLVQQENATITITVLGREFLKYIFQRGYSLTNRVG